MKVEGKHILDMTCGGRSIWFNKKHPLALYIDRREEEYSLTFGSNPSERHIKVHPDMIADFRELPFDDESFDLVVFDPPHIISDNGNNGWLTKEYGWYESKEEALESVKRGVLEAMRVLKPYGTLVFKWAETSIPTRDIIKAIGIDPLFGHRSGKKLGTNWMCFMKDDFSCAFGERSKK